MCNKITFVCVAMALLLSFAIPAQSQGPDNAPPDYFWMDTLDNIYNKLLEIDDKITPVPTQGPSTPKTGQTLCYDEQGDERDCAGTGEDGEFQSGVEWPDPRFSIESDAVAIDNLTGLMWLRNGNCMVDNYSGLDNYVGYGSTGDGAVTWQDALDFVAGINNGTYSDCGGGYTDWRLPNIRELFSLIDFGNYGIALPTGAPFGNVENYYWSSTTALYDPSVALAVSTYSGQALTFAPATLKASPSFQLFVWPVRGGN
jgi:hypothetical protein